MENDLLIQKPVDVLLCTALPEEAFVWERWLHDNANVKKVHPDGMVEVYGLPEAPTLHVALRCFDEVGNVGTAAALTKALRATAPHCVVMTGIAAGYYRKEGRSAARYFELGDVGFSKEVIYTAYSSVVDSKPISILRRALARARLINGQLDEGEPRIENRGSYVVPASESLVGIAKQLQAGASRLWIDNSAQLFSTYKARWEELFSEGQEPYPRPKAKAVCIASGESVVKSKTFQDRIVRQYLKTQQDVPVRMFEMEAFGLSTLCRAADVPFLVVKGISDHADSNKGDSPHLAAITAAVAFTTSLISHPDFASVITRPDFRPEHPSCLNPRVRICLYGEPLHRSSNNRPCITFGFTGSDLDANEAHVSRVFEGVVPRRYSKALSTYFNELLDDTRLGTPEKATLFFPYSPKALIDYICQNPDTAKTKELALRVSEELDAVQKEQARNDNGGRLISWDDPSFPWNTIDNAQEITRRLVELGMLARGTFQHFADLTNRCNELTSMGFSGLASKVARVIVCDCGSDRIWANPTYVVYPALLGFSVPSYFSDTLARDQLFVEADVNFVETDFAVPALLKGGIETGRVQALRFASSTHTLIISGKPCNACGELGEPNKVLQSIQNWRERAKPPDGNHDAFPRFPLAGLARKHLEPGNALLQELDSLYAVSPAFFTSPPELPPSAVTTGEHLSQ